MALISVYPTPLGDTVLTYPIHQTETFLLYIYTRTLRLFWLYRTTMKLHACRHCGSRLRTYTELQEHLKTHPNVCVTCYRVFSNRSILLAHTCKVEEYLCEICQRSYSTQTKLARHKRETSCHHSLPPEAKRQKPTPPIEDLEAPPPPPLVDEYGSELQDVIIQNWGSIRTHTSHGPVQSRYNFRLMTSDIGGLELGHIFTDQTTAFKINISYGFILRNRTSGRYKYYHSSCNCCGRYLDEPSLITNADTFENFLERINEPDILKWALNQRPNSDWVVEIVTNATIFVNRILQHPIGCVGIVLPPHVKYNQSVTGLAKDHHGRPYVDNLCLFRCMGLHLGHDPNTLYAKYTDQPVETFEGVTITSKGGDTVWSEHHSLQTQRYLRPTCSTVSVQARQHYIPQSTWNALLTYSRY